MNMWLRLSLFALGFWIVTASSPLASAQEAPEFRITEAEQKRFELLSQEAARYYGEGNYSAAIESFQAAYAIKPASNILYNVGRIYERQGKLAEAVSFYEQFVVAPDVEIKARQDAAERLKTLREIIAMSAPKSEEKSSTENTQAAAESVKASEARPSATPTPTPPQPLAVNERDSTLPWILIGSGAAVAITGGVFAYLAGVEFDRYDATSNPARSVIQQDDGSVIDAGPTILETRREAIDSGELYSILADLGIGIGVVSASLGVVWLFLNDSSESDVSFRPLGGADWGTSVTIRF